MGTNATIFLNDSKNFIYKEYYHHYDGYVFKVGEKLKQLIEKYDDGKIFSIELEKIKGNWNRPAYDIKKSEYNYFINDPIIKSEYVYYINFSDVKKTITYDIYRIGNEFVNFALLKVGTTNSFVDLSISKK
jgi:hypothetical protein